MISSAARHGRCLLALDETEEGIARLKESRAIWERLKATPHIAEIDETLKLPSALRRARGLYPGGRGPDAAGRLV